MADDKVFADGFLFKRRETAPEFVIGEISVKVDEAIAFLKENQKNGWVNLDVKLSKGGRYYMELNTFTPKPKEQEPQAEVEDDLPF